MVKVRPHLSWSSIAQTLLNACFTASAALVLRRCKAVFSKPKKPAKLCISSLDRLYRFHRYPLRETIIVLAHCKLDNMIFTECRSKRNIKRYNFFNKFGFDSRQSAMLVPKNIYRYVRNPITWGQTSKFRR